MDDLLLCDLGTAKRAGKKSAPQPHDDKPPKSRRKVSSQQKDEQRVDTTSTPPRPQSSLIRTLTRHARCAACGMDTPFCCATGLAHAAVPACPRCGLSTLFCPQTGRPHGSDDTPTPPLESLASSTPAPQRRSRAEPKTQRDGDADEAGDGPPTTTKRVESRSSGGPKNTRPSCVHCTKRIVSGAVLIECPICSRNYHTTCYRVNTGYKPEPDTPPAPCSVCVSGLLPAEPHGDPFVAELLTQGFAVVPMFRTAAERDALVDVIAGLDADVASLFDGLMKAHEGSGTTRSLAEGYANFRERGQGRFEILMDHLAPSLMPLWEASPCADVVRAALSHDDAGGPPALVAAGCFYSTTGSTVQPWHSDGPPLVPLPLRPYAINAFIPTVAVDRNNGTALKPKSMLREADGEAAVIPRVDVGYALLFDYRVQHRGLTNRTSKARPCLYLTFAQPWYSDAYNFSTTRYRHKLEPHTASGGVRPRRPRRPSPVGAKD